MTYADTTGRQEFIAGLRELADFLENNPAVPAPKHTTDILVFPPHVSDDEKKQQVDHIAFRIGSETTTSYGGHYCTSRRFGPVEYRAVAIPTRDTREG